MEQQTKNCPYCGEVIMAVAKKCKHCGEWLTPQEEKEEITATTEPASNDDEQPNGMISKSIPKYASISFWLVFLGGVFSFINNGCEAGVTRFMGKRTTYFKDVSGIIPEPLDDLLDGLGFVCLFLLLMKLTKALGKPLNALCISAAVLYGISAICSMAEADIMGVLFILSFSIILFIIGIKLSIRYQKSLRLLGIGMIIWNVFDFVFIGIALEQSLEGTNFLEDFFWVEPLSTVIFGYVFASCLTSANNTPAKK